MRGCHFREHCVVMDERLSDLPGIADLFEVKYCEGDHTQCARHILAELVGRDSVPEHLMPNDHGTASRSANDYPFPA